MKMRWLVCMIACVFFVVFAVGSPWCRHAVAKRVLALVYSMVGLSGVNAPIEYYGKVIDQDGKGIGDVEIEAKVLAESPLPDLHSEGAGTIGTVIQVTTDENGCFSVTGERGASLVIQRVSKPGYIPHADTDTSAMYGSTRDPSVPMPDPKNPVTMHMWRKNGSAWVVNVGLLYRSSPRAEDWDKTFDLICWTGSLDRSTPHYGKVRITASRGKPRDPTAKRGRGTCYDWSFRIEMLDGGGLIETDDAFLFAAPEKGYVPIYSFQMKSMDARWISNVQKKFYFREPGTDVYGALFAEVTTHWPDGPHVSIRGYANPGGSRNLEHEGSIP